MTDEQQNTILAWLRGKGNTAPRCLCDCLGIDPAKLCAAMEASALATRIAELAPALAELQTAGVDLAAVAREHRDKIAAEQAALKAMEDETRE